MASVSPESAWEFAEAIKSVVGKPTTKRRATVQSVDKDGTIWVQLPGSSTTTPIASTGANVSPGDTVLTELRGTQLHITENSTDPAIGQRTAGDIARKAAKPAVDAAKAAEGIAGEAKSIASATGQHFWDDDNGAYVTDVTREEWETAEADGFSDLSDAKPYHNLLMNSLGILLRRALYNLVSVSKSAIAFFDGLGNNASNIVAWFGSAGAQIGKSDESHMELDYHSMKMVDKEGHAYFHVSDLRGVDGTASIVDTFTGDGSTTRFELSLAAVDNNYDVSVSDSSGGTITKDTRNVDFQTAPSSGAVITVAYVTKSQDAKAYTFGMRKPSSKIGAYSFVEGLRNQASGSYSHAEGIHTTASGKYSHAEGSSTTASGLFSHAEGSSTTASGDWSHAEGSGSTASGLWSHAEGNLTTASGLWSHAEGGSTTASGLYSHAQNRGTIAASHNQTAIGKFNLPNTNQKYALIVGNGADDENRSNAHTLDWNGNAVYAGDVTDGTGNVLSDKLDASAAASTYLPKTALTVDTYTQEYTAAANSLSGAITIDVSKTGYTPLGIVGFACGAGGAAIEQASISGTTATLYIRNVTSSAISRNCTINVLYVAVV